MGQRRVDCHPGDWQRCGRLTVGSGRTRCFSGAR
jgi:hypothetical protein